MNNSKSKSENRRIAAIIDSRDIYRNGLSLVVRDHLNHLNTTGFANIESYLLDCDKSENTTILLRMSDMLSDDAFYLSIEAIFKHNASVRIIVYDISADITIDSIRHLASLGIVGLLSEISDTNELILCISAIEAGRRYINNSLAWDIVTSERSRQKFSTSKSLTSVESKVANELIKGTRISDIARTTNRKTSTISTLKKRVFRKMGVKNIIDLKDRMHMANSIQGY